MFFFWIYRLGCIASYWFPELDKLEKPVIGFILGLAFFQILATPVLAFHLSFDLIYYPLLVFIFLSIAVSYFLRAKEIKNDTDTVRKDRFLSSFKGWHHRNTFIAIAVTIVLFQAIMSTYLQNPSGDDAYYLSSVLTNYHSTSVLKFDPASGMENIPPQGQYSFQSWEMLQGVFSRALGVHPAELAHTILPFGLILLCNLAFYMFAKRVLPESMVPVFIIFLSIVHLFAGYSVVTPGIYLLAWIWQGKALILLFIFPCLYAFTKDYLEHNGNTRYLVLLVIISITAISLNPIAVYLVPMLVFSILLPECIRRKQIRPIIKAAVILLPLAIYAYFIRDSLADSYTFNNLNSHKNFSSFRAFKYVVVEGGYTYLLYFGALIYMLFRKNDYLKSLILYSPLTLFVFVWNPIFAPYIAKYVTSFTTYWRVFWLLPIGIGISLMGCLAIENFHFPKLKIITALCIVILIIINGSWMYQSKHSFSNPENTYKLDASDIQVVGALLVYPGVKNSVVLAPLSLDQTLRQITPDFRLF